MKTTKTKFEKFSKKSTLNSELLAQIKGGANGEGWIKSVSGDCNTSGRSCWKAIFNDILPF